VRRLTTGLALALIVACSGIGGSATSTTATSTTVAATTTSTVAVNTRYESVFDIRERIEASGFTCTSWEIRGPNDYTVESADCTDAVVIAIHENASQAQAQIDLRAQLLGGIGGSRSVTLLGPNWSVNCGGDEGLCEELALVLGGEVQVAEPPE